MTVDEVRELKDGTRVVVTMLGSKWEEDIGWDDICIKIGNRLYIADYKIPPDDHESWYHFYGIDEINEDGYEFEVELE